MSIDVKRIQPDRWEVFSAGGRNPTGLEATAAIMATCPTPVMVLSRVEFEAELSRTNGLGAGAVAVVEKPRAFGLPQFERMAREG